MPFVARRTSRAGGKRMRVVFGVLGLLIAVAIVSMLAKQQLRAVQTLPSAAPLGAAPVAQGADPSVREQSQTLQRGVADAVNQQLQQGALRASEAE